MLSDIRLRYNIGSHIVYYDDCNCTQTTLTGLNTSLSYNNHMTWERQRAPRWAFCSCLNFTDIKITYFASEMDEKLPPHSFDRYIGHSLAPLLIKSWRRH